MKFSQKGCVAWLVAAAALTLFLAVGLLHHTAGVAFAQELLTNENVIAMVRAGLPEGLIVAKIQSTQTKFDLTTNGLIALKKAGVPDNILMTMLSRESPGAPSAPAAGAPGVPAPASPAMAGPPPAATVPGSPMPTAVTGFAPGGAPQPFVPPGGNVAPGASGCPQLAQPDPYQDLRNSLGQFQGQAAQPGAQLAQYTPLVNQLQATLGARDAALRQGACDTSQYDGQISSLAGNLQTAMASPAQPGGATPFPQQAGVPGVAFPGAPPSPGPEAQSPLGAGGDMFSKLFDTIQGLARKPRTGGDSASGPMMAAPSAGAFSPEPAPPPSVPGPSPGFPPGPSSEPTPGPAPPPSSPATPAGPVATVPGPSPGFPPGPSPGPTPGSPPSPASPSSPATPAGPVATVAGTVKNESGVALASAKVTAVEWNKSTTTAPDGTYYLQGPGGQKVTVQVEASGYQKNSNVTSVRPGAVTWQNFALKKATQPTPTKFQLPPALQQQIQKPSIPRP